MLWCRGVVYYLSGEKGVVGYVLWLLAVPLSFALYYKFYVCYLLCSDLLVLLFWALYRFSEQFYLVKWVMRNYVPKFTFKFCV